MADETKYGPLPTWSKRASLVSRVLAAVTILACMAMAGIGWIYHDDWQLARHGFRTEAMISQRSLEQETLTYAFLDVAGKRIVVNASGEEALAEPVSEHAGDLTVMVRYRRSEPKQAMVEDVLTRRLDRFHNQAVILTVTILVSGLGSGIFWLVAFTRRRGSQKVPHPGNCRERTMSDSRKCV